MGRWLATWVLGHRVAVLVAIAIITIIGLAGTTRLAFDSRLDIWFLEDDPEILTYQAFLEAFQTDEVVVVGLFAPDIWDPAVLSELDNLTRGMAEVPQVRHCRSLANAQVFAGEDLSPALLFSNFPPSTSEIVAAKEKVQTPLLRFFVAPDGKAAAIVVALDPSADTFEEKVAVVQGLKRLASTSEFEVHLAGTPVINEAVFRYSREDLAQLGLIAVLMIFAVGFVVFRHLPSAVLPLTVVVLAVVWLLGLMGWLGLKLDLLSQALVTVLLAVGVADSIHVIADYHRLLALGHLRRDALIEAVDSVFVPAFFTCLTTAAGLLSLTSSHLAPVRRVGWLEAIGVGFALILALSWLVVILSFLARPQAAVLERRPLGSVLFSKLGQPSVGRQRAVLASFVALTLGGIWLARDVPVGANPAAYFREQDPVRQNLARIDAALGGSTTIELLVRSKEKLEDPAILARLDQLADYLETLPAVTQVVSVNDVLRQAKGAVTGTVALPATKNEAAQLYLLLEDQLGALITPDLLTARLSAQVRMSEAAALAAHIPQIEAELALRFPDPSLTVTPTGFVKLISEMELYIVESQVQSFSSAWVTITILLMLVLKSWRLGLFALIPNITPVILGLAFMKLMGIRLDPGTAMIAGITLGLVVDDTVHLMKRVESLLSKGATLEVAVAQAVAQAGPAVVATSVILATGFGVLALGRFSPNVHLGTISALVILSALVADLWVTPAALLRWGPYLRLGKTAVKSP